MLFFQKVKICPPSLPSRTSRYPRLPNVQSFIKLLIILHSNSKSCMLVYFEPRQQSLKARFRFFIFLQKKCKCRILCSIIKCPNGKIHVLKCGIEQLYIFFKTRCRIVVQIKVLATLYFEVIYYGTHIRWQLRTFCANMK